MTMLAVGTAENNSVPVAWVDGVQGFRAMIVVLLQPEIVSWGLLVLLILVLVKEEEVLVLVEMVNVV